MVSTLHPPTTPACKSFVLSPCHAARGAHKLALLIIKNQPKLRVCRSCCDWCSQIWCSNAPSPLHSQAHPNAICLLFSSEIITAGYYYGAERSRMVAQTIFRMVRDDGRGNTSRTTSLTSPSATSAPVVKVGRATTQCISTSMVLGMCCVCRQRCVDGRARAAYLAAAVNETELTECTTSRTLSRVQPVQAQRECSIFDTRGIGPAR